MWRQQNQLLAMSMNMTSSRQSPGSAAAASPSHSQLPTSQLVCPPPHPPPSPGMRLPQGGPSSAGHMFPYGPALPAISESFFAEYARTFMPPPPSVIDPSAMAVSKL